VVYGRFDSKIQFENESDGRFDSKFDSNEKKNDSQVPNFDQKYHLTKCLKHEQLRTLKGKIRVYRAFEATSQYQRSLGVAEKQNSSTYDTKSRRKMTTTPNRNENLGVSV